MFTQLKNKLTLTSSFKTAPNIGLIKYWGKWNEKELIPLNDNVGVTLNSKDVFTTTKILLNPESATNQLIINGKDFPISDRIQRIFSIFKENIKCKVSANAYKNSPSDKPLQEVLPNVENYGIIVESSNSFPTGSGLASSSSGLSALALCLTDLLKVNSPDVRYISRIGSGSACRCLFGNFVQFPGVRLDYLDQPNNEEIIQQESKRCLPFELTNSDWLKYETKILILTDSIKGQKDVLSRDGMRQTWLTSQLIQHRVRVSVPQHLQQLNNALENKNFNAVMEVITRDSNNFHATCQDTYPPLLYLNDFSRQIIKTVHLYNKTAKKLVGYTFDAGSHAVVLIHNSEFDNFYNFLLNEKIGQDYKQISTDHILQTSIGGAPISLI